MSRSAQDGLFGFDSFSGFGPSRFRPSTDIPASHRLRARKGQHLKPEVREHAPRRPGVYGMLDARGRVIYVGKAKNLRARLLSYFRTESRDPKAGRILDHTRILVWEEAAHEFAALLRELELIRRFRPRFNVIGQPGPRRTLYLCLGKRPAPYAYLTRDPTGSELACYGPIMGRAKAEEAIRRLNDWFKLRDCSRSLTMVFADQPGLFPDERSVGCLRYDIGTCLAPCAGLCTRTRYTTQVRSAKAFLDGHDRSLLNELTRRMSQAAAELKFEQATALRDRLTSLAWLDDRLSFLRTARRKGSYIYRLKGHDEAERWYLIHRGEVAGVFHRPTDDASLATTFGNIEALCQAPAADRVTDRTVDSILLVTAWFKKFADEKARLISWPAGQDLLRRDAE